MQRLLLFLSCGVVCLSDSITEEANTNTVVSSKQFTWDPNGYIIFCPCMGRFGNQAEHYLGAMAFAKSIDRTLILPPFRTYKNVPFDEWFKFEPVTKFHRAILAEDFMKHLGPLHWPAGQRAGWCWKRATDADQTCSMKEGNPFGPFWDGLNVSFDSSITYELSYSDYLSSEWKTKFPAAKYPVMAMKGAPAPYPMLQENRHIQRYLQWSDSIEEEAQAYINKNFNGSKFIGIHLRNGVDWVNACNHLDKTPYPNYMASPQCKEEQKGQDVTQRLCFPPKKDILRQTKNIALQTRATFLYVATDKDPMLEDFKSHLKSIKVEVFHHDPWLPQINLAILGKSTHFIGNCVSSFTSFVKRERDLNNLPSSFWTL